MNRRSTFWASILCCFFFAPLTGARAGGYALQFNNIGNQSVIVPFAPALNMYPLTVTAWVKTSQQDFFNFENTPILRKDNGFTDGWSLSILLGEIRASYVANGGSSYVSDSPPGPSSGLNGGFIADDNWHHIAFTVDASGGKLYVDGVLRTNRAWVGFPAANTFSSQVVFGRGSSSYQYIGLLDEITLWNSALTQAQIQTNKNRSFNGNETNLIAYYRCDDSTGFIVTDSASAGGLNNGNRAGATIVASNAPVATPPSAQTVAATTVTANSAVLQGVVNPAGTNTFAWFEWGTTTNYGNVTTMIGMGFFTNDIPFGQSITGLLVGGTYHFRAVASNAFGVALGADLSFTTPIFEKINTTFTAAYGGVAWGDADNDGWLDLALGGTARGVSNNFVSVSEVWRNTGNGAFSLAYSNFINSADDYTFASWGDANNDGRLDLILAGGIGRLYRNTAAGFTNYFGGFGAIGSSFGAWGDFNNDGLLDILTGSQFNVFSVMRNTRTNFTSGVSGLPSGFTDSFGTWSDYDNDGLLDVVVAAYQGSQTQPEARIWRNAGGTFTNAFNLGICAAGSAAWGDYDNDGRMDLLLAGATNNSLTSTFVRVYRNTGSSFTNINAGLPGIASGMVAWADFDNDGLLDIALTGTNEFLGPISQIWRNTGSGFTNANAGLPGVTFSTLAWGDYDRDGRLDLALSGVSYPGTNFICGVWRNLTAQTNTPPSAPSGLNISLVNSNVVLSWDAATDAQTPANGLTYNVRIGSTPGGSDVLSSLASFSGTRKVARLGNTGTRRFANFTYTLDQPYYWSVQTVDSSFAGSTFSAEGSFRVLRPEPTLVPATVSALVPGDINNNGVVEASELNTVLSNYFSTSAWLQMTNVTGLGQTNVQFALTNDLSGALLVEFSTNLTEWQTVGPATPRYLFTDTNAAARPQSYYRLRLP